jgi:hypothetical protein
MDKYEKQHQRNLSAYERQVSAIFNQAIKEATLIGVSIEDLADDEILSFDKLPKTKKAVSKMLNTLASNLTVCIVNGVQSSWTLANSREDELCNQVFGDVKDLLTDAQHKRYYSNNGDALQAFLDRKEAGLKLSERVWKYADEFKEEIEMGLDLGIRDGVAANKMQKDLQQYLQHPDMLFRRVRDKYDNLQLSKRAKAYHPGAGVYRSSYKNARRLTVTETNMAYRTADYLRWQQMDFVVGIRVVKSNNHPDTDICDELSAPLGSTAVEGPGCYPKDFKFVGWHPHCRCHSESILKTEEELMAGNRRIMNGDEPSAESVNTVKDTPEAFNKWVKNNKERIESAKTLPYFIRDNEKYLPDITTRHGYEGLKLGRKATKQAKEAYGTYQPSHNYSKEQIENLEEAEKVMGIERGEPMTFDEADNGRSNKYHDINNCAECVFIHEMRLRGFDVTSNVYNAKDSSFVDIAKDTRTVWRTAKGKVPEFTSVIGGNSKEVRAKLLKQTDTIGARYHIGWDMSPQMGHIVTAERTKDGLIIYDPQRNEFLSLEGIIGSRYKDSKIELLRVDKLLLNIDLLNTCASQLV